MVLVLDIIEIKMNFEANTIDDLMYDILEELIKRPFDVIPTKGASSEIFGAMLQLNNPRARLSSTETRGKTFSALGEFLWYLSKSNDLEFIMYYIIRYKNYSDDGKIVYGGYGPRLFNMRGKHNQINRVIELLKEKSTTRQAVIQLFDAEDLLEKHKDIPCTCSLQFILRDNKLNMIVFMRSNDAYWGLPHDIFCFTMIQEIVARSLNVELGIYKHSVASLHLYEVSVSDAKQYIGEGFQPTKAPMPEMPIGNPWESIQTLMQFEQEIRNDFTIPVENLKLDNYWLDFAYLLKILALFKNRKYELIESEKAKINSEIYSAIVQKKIDDNKSKFAKIKYNESRS
ncbi:thymidylate synthase [Flavobacterium sp. TBRC 19031]|uniref:thymidylate synthase n=1 Tax=Flavobacterium mekongense TaxID=3379707 RepID=UPI0039994C43